MQMGYEGVRVENSPAEIRRKKVEYRFGNKDHTNAATYDTIRHFGRANEYRQTVMSKRYRKLIGPLQGKRILDVGCGRVEASSILRATPQVHSGVHHDSICSPSQRSERTPSSRSALLASYARQLP